MSILTSFQVKRGKLLKNTFVSQAQILIQHKSNPYFFPFNLMCKTKPNDSLRTQWFSPCDGMHSFLQSYYSPTVLFQNFKFHQNFESDQTGAETVFLKTFSIKPWLLIKILLWTKQQDNSVPQITVNKGRTLNNNNGPLAQ